MGAPTARDGSGGTRTATRRLGRPRGSATGWRDSGRRDTGPARRRPDRAVSLGAARRRHPAPAGHARVNRCRAPPRVTAPRTWRGAGRDRVVSWPSLAGRGGHDADAIAVLIGFDG